MSEDEPQTQAPSIREVRLGIYATERQAEEVKEQIMRLLCPDPEHASPCPIPWSISVLNGSDLEDGDPYPELIEQARVEQGRQLP